MLEWLPFGKKPDHPMHSIEAALELLADLSLEPDNALKELSSWLASLTGTTGFRLAERIALVKLLDETGQPIEPDIVRSYLQNKELKDYERMRYWELALEYWQHLGAAYQLCLADYTRHTKEARALPQELAVLVVRCLRALANANRISRLRYLAVKDEAWQALFDAFHLSETAGCDNARFLAYERDTLKTTPRCELLRALMLEAASPEALQPYQVELAARAAARFADSFLIKTTPEPACNWYLDLAHPGPPRHVSAQMTAGSGARFFGAGIALAKIDEVIKRLTENRDEKERRFGDDYLPHDKLLVLKHLRRHWSESPPGPREARRRSGGEVQVAHGFRDVTQLVVRVEFSAMAEISQAMDVNVRDKAGLALAADAQQVPTEKWPLRDISTWGLGAGIPRPSESWVRIGTLCALRTGKNGWAVGVVRRIYRDGASHGFAGLEVLAKRPVSVWLRGLGKGESLAENWATSSGSLDYNYLNVVLLKDSAASAERHELLLQRGLFQGCHTYEVMMGEAPPRLKFEELLEEGEDFERVRFSWVKADPAPARK